MHLVRDEIGRPTRVGRIVEVEAYGGPEDRASHARAGRTPRTAPMFGPPGRAYVYLVYGMHHCLNVVTGPEGSPGAVLIRAVEPVAGLDAMLEAHAIRSPGRPVTRRAWPDVGAASGPGRLGVAFGIDRAWTGIDLCDPGSPLRLELPVAGERAPDPVATPRVGISYAGEPWASLPWRVLDRGSTAISTLRVTSNGRA